MNEAQTLMGLHWVDAADGDDSLVASILFFSPRPDVASPGFNSLTRDTNASWVAQGRLGRDPAFQWTGSGEETITVEGRLYPHMFGGLKTMDRLREGTKGQRFILTKYTVEASNDANTDAYIYKQDVIPGPWGIRRVRQGDVRIGSHGVPLVVEFSVELVMIGADPGDGTGNDFFFGARAGYTGSDA